MNSKKDVIRFLMLAMGFYLAWHVGYDLWLREDGRLDNWLTAHVARGSVFVLQFTGYTAEIQKNVVYVDAKPMVNVWHPCNGLLLMALFTGFIAVFPGPVFRKFLYIPAGIAAIHLLNIMRVTALALTALYSPTSLDFNHKYTFTFFVYACIFGMWMLWVKKFSNHTLPIPHATTKTEMA